MASIEKMVKPFWLAEKLNEAVLELKELACSVRGFTEGDDPRIADDLGERLQVVEPMASLYGLQRDGVSANPVFWLWRAGPRSHEECPR